MKLYRHSIDCYCSMKRFLEANPAYWAFVPMLKEQVDDFDRQFSMATLTTITSDNNVSLKRSHNECEACILSIPKPPIGYGFTKQQRRKQYEFFYHKSDLTGPDVETDLYEASILSVCMLNSNDDDHHQLILFLID